MNQAHHSLGLGSIKVTLHFPKLNPLILFFNLEKLVLPSLQKSSHNTVYSQVEFVNTTALVKICYPDTCEVTIHLHVPLLSLIAEYCVINIFIFSL